MISDRGIEIEIGKFYKARNGMRAYVVGKDVVEADLLVVEYLGDSAHPFFGRVNYRGKQRDLAKALYDLVGEWRDEPALEFDWDHTLINKIFKNNDIYFTVDRYDEKSKQICASGMWYSRTEVAKYLYDEEWEFVK